MLKQNHSSAITTDNIKKRKKRKVIIVGAGGAGLVAAVAASQVDPEIEINVIEKNTAPGGITAIATGTIRACESSLQKSAGREGVTKADAIKQYLEVGKHYQDPVILEKFVTMSGAAIDWLLTLGCKIELLNDFRHLIAPAKEGLPGGTGLTEILYQQAKRAGVQFFFETRASDLVVHHGKVNGVKVIARDGKVNSFESDAVVLADGGFWGAPQGAFDMDIPLHLKDVIIAAEGAYVQGGLGDAARMGAAIGAMIQHTDALDYTAQRYINGKGDLCPIYGSAAIWSEAACIILNQSLDRFLNEDLCYAKETLTDEVAKELTGRHEKWFWNIWDETSKENAYRVRYWISQGFIEQGFIVTGNSIEELARNMEVDSVKLKKTLDRYNSYFEQGLAKDPVFGRDLKRERVHALNRPPFYALRAGIQCNNRRGGICADVEAHALNTDNKSIPGLYVAGSTMDAVKFDGMGWLSGTGFTGCVVWGRIAGTNVALGK